MAFLPSIPLSVLGLLLLSISARAVSVWTVPPQVEVPRALQVPSLKAEVTDPAWKVAVVLPPLQPGYGVSATVVPSTTVRLLWSPSALYVRFEARDSKVITPYDQRDGDLFKGDVAEVFLDPAGDQKVWYEFEVSPRNAVFDALHLCTGTPRWDEDGVLTPDTLSRFVWSFKEWNCPGFRSAARITPEGWIIEMALPPALLKSTGEKAFHPGVLRANFLRYDVDDQKPPSQILLNWSPVIVGRPHRSPARMGTLKLLP